MLGLILTTQKALKHFNGDGGSVINISSIVGVIAPDDSGWLTGEIFVAGGGFR